MAENPALKLLVADLIRLSAQLKAAVEEKDWAASHTLAKAILGVSSRTFSRCDGILKALDEFQL